MAADHPDDEVFNGAGATAASVEATLRALKDKIGVTDLPTNLSGIGSSAAALGDEVTAEEREEMAQFEALMRSPCAKHYTDIAVMANVPITNRESGAILNAAVAFVRELDQLMHTPENNGQPATMRVQIEACAVMLAMIAQSHLNRDAEARAACAVTGAVPLKIRGLMDLTVGRAAELLRQAAKENRPIL